MNKKIILSVLLIAIFSISALQSAAYAFGVNLQEEEKTVTVPVEKVEVDLTETGISVYANNNGDLEWDIYQYINEEALKPGTNITTLKKGIAKICKEYGVKKKPKIIVNTPYGKDSFIMETHPIGDSMYPTLKGGQTVIINKTQDIHVADIVMAYSQEYGLIMKRVGKIEGNRVFLISDNREVKVEHFNGHKYVTKSVNTWVNRSDIYGVAIDIHDGRKSNGISIS